MKEEKNNEINELKNEIQKLKKLINYKGDSVKDERININSNILNKSDLIFIENRLKKIDIFRDKNINYKLIYRATRDGGLPKDFHNKCDGTPALPVL